MFVGKSCLFSVPCYMHNANQDLLIHCFICDNNDDDNNNNNMN